MLRSTQLYAIAPGWMPTLLKCRCQTLHGMKQRSVMESTGDQDKIAVRGGPPATPGCIPNLLSMLHVTNVLQPSMKIMVRQSTLTVA